MMTFFTIIGGLFLFYIVFVCAFVFIVKLLFYFAKGLFSLIYCMVIFVIFMFVVKLVT